MVENRISKEIIGCAIRVHSELGPGLLESAYKRCLKYELHSQEIETSSEVAVPITYRSLSLDYGYRMDLLVMDKVVVEIKTIEGLNEVHLAQMLTYLKLGNFRLGLLINFNVTRLKNGIRRVIL